MIGSIKRLHKYRISKIGLCVLLSFCLAFATFAIPKKAYAEDKVIAASSSSLGFLDSAQNAVNITNKIITASGISKWGDIGAGLASFVSGLNTGLNVTSTILKFLGFGGNTQTASLEIKMYEEIQDMHKELTQLTEKVDGLVNQLAEFKAQYSFNERINTARDMNNRWNSFDQSYMESGMEDLLNTYNWKIRTGIKNWYTNDDYRNNKFLNDDKFYLVYQFEPGSVDKYNLALYTDQIDANELQSKYDKAYSERLHDKYWQRDKAEIVERETKEPYFEYIGFPKQYLPDLDDNFSIDNYKDKFKQQFIANIRPAFENHSLDIDDMETIWFVNQHFNDWTEEQRQEMLNKLSADMLDVIINKISGVEVNNDDNFTKDVIKKYNDYCVNLTGKTNQGLDALLQSIYLSNAFEGEAKDTINTFCASMALKTSQYATFAIDVIGKSDMATKDENDESSDLMKVTSNWNNSINVIDAAQSKGITGCDDYCYITNSRVSVMPLKFSLGMDFKSCFSKWDSLRMLDTQVQYKDNGDRKYIVESFIPDCNTEKSPAQCMLSESQSALVDYYYLSKKNPDVENYSSFGSFLKSYLIKADTNGSSLVGFNFNNFALNYNTGCLDITNEDNNHAIVERWKTFAGEKDINWTPENKTNTIGQLNRSDKYNIWNKKINVDLLDAESGTFNKNQPIVMFMKGKDNWRNNDDWVAAYPDSNSSVSYWPSDTYNDVPRCLDKAQNTAYTLVVNDMPVKLMSAQSSYNPLNSLQETQNAFAAATTMGTGNVVLIAILCALGASAITAVIMYSALRKKDTNKANYGKK